MYTHRGHMGVGRNGEGKEDPNQTSGNFPHTKKSQLMFWNVCSVSEAYKASRSKIGHVVNNFNK